MDFGKVFRKGWKYFRAGNSLRTLRAHFYTFPAGGILFVRSAKLRHCVPKKRSATSFAALRLSLAYLSPM